MPFSLRLEERRTLLIVVDLVFVNATTLLALWIMAARAGWPFDRAYLLDQSGWFFFLSAFWLLSAFINGFYDTRKITDISAAAIALLRTIALITVAYFAIYFFLATPGSLPRGVVGYQGAASFILIALWRVLYVALIQRPSFARKVIIVGGGWAGRTIAQAINGYAKAHYQIVGFVDDDPAKQGALIPIDGNLGRPRASPFPDGYSPSPEGVVAPATVQTTAPVVAPTLGQTTAPVPVSEGAPEPVLSQTPERSEGAVEGWSPSPAARPAPIKNHKSEISEQSGDPATYAGRNLPVLGTSHDLVRLVKENGVSEVILAVSHNASSALMQGILDCKEQGVQITLMPVLYEQLAGQIPIEHIGDNWNVALPLDSAEAGGFYPMAKRLFDIVGALVGLALFAILLPFIALAIRLDSPGPIFYRHERVGKGGKRFNLIKLRTMIQNAEPDGHALRAQAHDSRVTRVGRLLRKMRLDEMPQLVNILKSDMSAVGPRPERPEHLAELDKLIPFHRLRNSVKPGMAGWAVVNYDYIDSIEDARIRLQYDLYYIKHQSLWLDLIILLRTMGHMLMLRGR